MGTKNNTENTENYPHCGNIGNYNLKKMATHRRQKIIL